jgi:hypothetical protein
VPRLLEIVCGAIRKKGTHTFFEMCASLFLESVPFDLRGAKQGGAYSNVYVTIRGVRPGNIKTDHSRLDPVDCSAVRVGIPL